MNTYVRIKGLWHRITQDGEHTACSHHYSLDFWKESPKLESVMRAIFLPDPACHLCETIETGIYYKELL